MIFNEVLIHAGEAFRRGKMYRRAQEYFSKALEMDPRNYQVRLRNAIVLAQLGEREGSESCFELLIKDFPAKKEAWNWYRHFHYFASVSAIR